MVKELVLISGDIESGLDHVSFGNVWWSNITLISQKGDYV